MAESNNPSNPPRALAAMRPRDLGARARTLPFAVRLPFILTPFALGLYWTFSDNGPHRWIVALEDRLLGLHGVVGCGFFAIVVALVPSVVLLQLVAVLVGRRRRASTR